jgi:hypothetical protein
VQSPSAPIVVDLDPDGTWRPWAAVVIEVLTGVSYSQQCACVANEERFVEGYLVPLDGLLRDPDDGRLDPLSLTGPFHGPRGRPAELDAEVFGRFAALVSNLAFWYRDAEGKTHREGLELDRSREPEIAEGWAPVRTPIGPGILVWTNCD